MLEIEAMIELQIMYKQGMSLKAIARETNYSINTVRKYARDHAEPGYRPRPIKPQKLDGHRDYIKQRIEQAYPDWIPATVIYQELQRRGYGGSQSLLCAYMQTLKPALKDKATIRFETKPGEQGQVDFAHFRYEQWVFYAFIALLGYSRMAYVEFVQDQQLATLLSCHEHAFNYFGGVAKRMLYDNMKTIVIKRNAYGQGQHRLQPGFLDFAKHYRFVPSLCRPHHPQTKGKIERFIHYLRHSFYIPWVSQFKGEESFTLSDINNAVSLWLSHVANQRLHAELKAKPCILWQEELNDLQPLPIPYPFALPQSINLAQETSYRSELLMQDTYSLQHDLAVYDDLCQGGSLWHS